MTRRFCRFVFFVCCFIASVTGCRKEDAAVPTIVLDETTCSVSAEGGSFLIGYRIDNISSGLPDASSSDDWITDVRVVDDITLAFKVGKNTAESSREGSVTLSYPGAESCSVLVMQEGGSLPDPDIPDEEASLTLEISNITSFTADVEVIPSNDTLTYVILTGLKSDVDAFGSDEALIEYNLGVFSEAAASYGVSLEYLLQETLLYNGRTKGTMDTFEPEKEYYIYTYGLEGDATVTTSVYKEPFSTPEVRQYGETTIDFEIESRKTREITVGVRPESTDYRYLAGYFTDTDFESVQDDFINFMIQEMKVNIYMNNALGNMITWDDVTYSGDCTLRASGLYSESDYVFYAFGVERGYANTGLFYETVSTSPVNVTDDCTFDTRIEEEGVYSVRFSVSPSSPSTRYVVMVTESADIIGLPLSTVADACINSLNEEGIDWTSDYRVSQGDISESYDGLAPLTSYNLVIFGISPDGERTTDVELVQFITETVPPSDMNFSVNINETAYSYLDVTINPSLQDEDYVFGIMTYEKYQELGADANTVRDYIVGNNPVLALYSGKGDISQRLNMDISFDFIRPGQEYVVFVFGSSWWIPTTDMETVRCSTPERVVSDAEVDIVLTVFDGNDMVAYDPVRYPAETYKDKAAIYIQFVPNASVVEWYGWLEARSADYMGGLNYDVLLSAIKQRGTYFDTPAVGTTFGVLPWDYQNYSVLSLGIDGNGDDGEPVIKSLCVSREQAVDFDPSVMESAQVPFRTAPSVMPEHSIRRMDMRLVSPSVGTVPCKAAPMISREDIEAVVEKNDGGFKKPEREACGWKSSVQVSVESAGGIYMSVTPQMRELYMTVGGMSSANSTKKSLEH